MNGAFDSIENDKFPEARSHQQPHAALKTMRRTIPVSLHPSFEGYYSKVSAPLRRPASASEGAACTRRSWRTWMLWQRRLGRCFAIR